MFYLYLFIFGCAIGSFLNVLIDRLPNEESILGRSHCDHCKKKLNWYDLIPVVSFITLRGRCRSCKKRLSFQYPVVEIITGILFVLITNFKLQITNEFQITNFQISNIYYLIPYLGIVACLIVIFFADLKYQIIPDSMQIGLLLFSLSLKTQFIAGIIIILPILFLYLITKTKGMGFGDVKLAFVMGVLLGIKGGLIALYIAFITGAVIGLLLIVLRRKKLKSKIAFGPFLVLGTTIVLFWQDKIFEIVKKFYGI